MLASPAEDAAEILTRLGPTVWVEDKYDGIRAQLHRAGTTVRLYSRDLHDVSGQFPEVTDEARDLAWDGHPRRRAAGVSGRPGAAVPVPPGAPRPQVAVGGDPGAGPGHLRRLRPPGAHAPRAAAATSSPDEASVVEPTLGLPLAERRRLLEGLRPAARRRGRSLRPVAPRDGVVGGRARADLRRGAGAPERGPDGQGPPERLFARPARPGLAEDEEGARDDRLRRRGRRGRPRQAPRRAVGLHVRRPRRDRPASWSRSARPTAA